VQCFGWEKDPTHKKVPTARRTSCDQEVPLAVGTFLPVGALRGAVADVCLSVNNIACCGAGVMCSNCSMALNALMPRVRRQWCAQTGVSCV
jgi:hypothetical protein